MKEYLGKDKKLYAAFMDLEKAYDRVDREALWSVLRIYGVSGQLLKGIRAFYRKANACVRVGGEFSESFAVEVGVRQGCVMSPWLLNIFMDGCMRALKHKVVNAGAKLRLNGEVWSVVTGLFADETVLLAESERDLLRVVNEFFSVCKRRNMVGGWRPSSITKCLSLYLRGRSPYNYKYSLKKKYLVNQLETFRL